MILPSVLVRFDMRSPEWGAARATLYEAALDMASYADSHGFEALLLSEHHGVDDGYCPSSIILGAAMAARTRRIKLRLSAIVVPLHDPLHLAEELALLDNLSQGRTELVAVGGYVQSEFDMFGQDFARRGAAVEECISTLRAAWTGEPFTFRGRKVRITPRPHNPHLPIYLGGAAPVAARRAARIADGFNTHDMDLYRIYEEEAKRLGRECKATLAVASAITFISNDPDRTWELIGRHALHETEGYTKWQKAQNVSGSYKEADDLNSLKATGTYVVVTPEQCVEVVREHGVIMFHPLLGGLDPEVGFETLRLYVEEVIPRL